MKDTLSLYSFGDGQFTGFNILVCLGVVLLASLFVKSSYRQQSRRVGYASIPPHEELDMQDGVVSGGALSSI
jgi:hypothetical protein